MEISLSILDLENENFVREIYNLEQAGIRRFHIDVIDGQFAGEKSNIENMYEKAYILNQVSLMTKDIHIMAYDVENIVEKMVYVEPQTITFQYEAIAEKYGKEKVFKIIEKIKEEGVLAGIAIKPETNIEEVEDILPKISKLTIMTVEPGKGGQKFIPEMIKKIEKAVKIREEKGYSYILEADGGINNIFGKILRKKGLDIAVVGSYIVKSRRYKQRIEKIKGETMLVNTKEMLLKAKKENYAIGAFNFTNMESFQAIIEAAEEEKSPVIMQTSSSAIKYMGIEYILKMVEAAEETVSVPFALHLDHGADFEIAKKCIDAGYSSVMIDASSLPFEENIALTKKVVEYAHPRGVTVEAEIGRLAGIEDEVNVSSEDAIYTKPEEAKEFVERTGCDSLAIAIGTSHGAYKFKGEPKLRFDILKQITELLPQTPIVLHGASTVIQELLDTANKYGAKIPGAKGCPDEILHEASVSGVNKINVDTDLRLAVTSEVRKLFVEKPEVFDTRAYFGAGKEKMKEIIKHKMKNVFMCSGKA